LHVYISGESRFIETSSGLVCREGGGICIKEDGCQKYCLFIGFKSGGDCIPFVGGDTCCCRK